MNVPRVSNMESPRTDKPVANQFIIEDSDREIFQSYQSVIGVKYKGEITLDESKWDYSVTTSKYRNRWLGMNTKEIKERIADGRIKLADLN